MSESKFETVSSLVDNYQANDAMFDEMIKDKHLSDTWDRYHLIGDVMRDDAPASIQLDLSSQIADAIANEPTVLAPKASTSTTQNFKAKVVQLIKPVGQIAIAASAAGLMVLGVQQNVAENEVLAPSQVVQTIPLGGIADPVSFNYQQNNRVSQKQAYIEQQRRFQALLSDHQQQIKLNSVRAEDAPENKAEDLPK